MQTLHVGENAGNSHVLPKPPHSGDVAQAGPDGTKVRDLLTQAKHTAIAQIHDLIKPAVERLLSSKQPTKATRLLNPTERVQLQNLLASISGTANLLGRAAIRRRAEQAKRFSGGRFSDAETDFTCFASGIPLLVPEKALAWFKALVPSLTAPARWVAGQVRKAFTMAAATEEGMLRQVKAAIERNIEQGVDATPAIQDVLDEAGVTPKQPNYSEMIARTNLMQAYTQGHTEELQDPEIQAIFPVWRYDGIDDGRQGPDHAPHFGKYYRTSTPFDTVRGARVYNCRCVGTPVTADEWRALQRQGAQVSG